MSTEIVKVHNLTKKYQNKVVLNNLSFVVHVGERIGIIGANGSGKSTLSEIIAGIRPPTRGEVIKSPGLRVGIQFQDSKYPMGITVMDMIRYYCDTFKIKYDKDELLNLLATYQLTNLAKKNINSLSGGQQQRLNILLAVIHQPDLVILDEVSSGLDIEVKEIIFTFLETNIIANHRAMLLVSHNMEEIERFCERILYLHAGELKADLPVRDVVKDYGSVFNYTKAMFDYYKSHESAANDNEPSQIKRTS